MRSTDSDGVEYVSNFRVTLPPDREFSDRELEWNGDRAEWRLSDKEYGSVRWSFDREPRSEDRAELRNFFHLSADVSIANLRNLNPGELARLQGLTSGQGPAVHVKRCVDFRSDWLVWRRESDEWPKYGRNCQGHGWWFGAPSSQDFTGGRLKGTTE